MKASADLHPYKMLKSGISAAEALELGPSEARRTRVDLIAEDPVLLLLGSQITLLAGDQEVFSCMVAATAIQKHTLVIFLVCSGVFPANVRVLFTIKSVHGLVTPTLLKWSYTWKKGGWGVQRGSSDAQDLLGRGNLNVYILLGAVGAGPWDAVPGGQGWCLPW